MDELQARHRKELKELAANVTALKKSVGKGAADKKKKKEVMDHIAQMEADMAQKHAREIEEFKAAEASLQQPADHEPQETVAEEEAPTQPTAEVVPKKPNRQQQRKAKKAAEMDEMRKQAEEEAANTVNMREVEEKALVSLLGALNLRIHEVNADGHCLYNAIGHQLATLDDVTMSYKEVRRLAGTYMRQHPDDFLPFLVNDDGDLMTPEQYSKYCDDVENSATWGGQLEIQALSMALKREIHVIQMGSPTIKIGEQFKAKTPLVLSYHRHSFGLGEHYNSCLSNK